MEKNEKNPQLSPLRPITTHITTHSPNGKATLHSSRPGTWTSYDQGSMAFNVCYTTSEFPATLTDEVDIVAHDRLVASQSLGLVNPRGTVCRMVDFAPRNPALVHRTQSLDYGIVVEGEIEMIFGDDDEAQVVRLGRGDVVVQRATMHGWRNPSETHWARMCFVLQDCREVVLGGDVLREDLGRARDIRPSGN